MSPKSWTPNEKYISSIKLDHLRWRLRKTPRALGMSVCGLMLMLPGALLSGCHHLPTQPCDLPAPVSMPALSQPLPPVNYSISARDSIKSWAKTLTDTSTTSKR